VFLNAGLQFNRDPVPSNKRHLFSNSDAGATPLGSGQCPLCNGGNASFGVSTVLGLNRVFQGWCPACTNVRIAEGALDTVKKQHRAHLLSAAVRCLSETIWQDGYVITVSELDSYTSSVLELSVLDQFDAALKLICEMCPMVGLPSAFNYLEDWPLLTTEGPDTALYILWQLAEMGYLKNASVSNAPPIPPKPTWKGYERLQQIQTSGRNSQNGFVAMSFAPSQAPVWQSVMEPGITEAGYKPIRVDRYEHTNRIDDEIMAQIRRCRFLVADFTGQRNGVYFEAGFAQGLGRNVIWMCHESDKGNLHFDTRQYNHIFYGDDLAKARAALTNRIVAREGEGALKAGLAVPSK